MNRLRSRRYIRRGGTQRQSGEPAFYEFRVEDVAELVGIEEALRRDLREGIDNLISNQVVNGNGSAPNVSGILDAVNATPSNTPGSADHFGAIIGRFFGRN